MAATAQSHPRHVAREKVSAVALPAHSLPTLHFTAVHRARIKNAAVLAAAWRRDEAAVTTTPMTDAVGIWVLHYADITATAIAEKINATPNCLCLVVGVDEKFPFTEELRARARRLCAAATYIETPSQIQNDDVWQHQLIAVLAKTTTTGATEGKGAADLKAPSPATAPRSRIDFDKAAAAYTVPLVEIHKSMRRCLPAAPLLPTPLSSLSAADTQTARWQILQFLQSAVDDRHRDFAYSGLFLLFAARRRQGADTTTLCRDILAAVPDNGVFHPLKRVVAVLYAEARAVTDDNAQKVIGELLYNARKEAKKEPLFYAIVLRAALNTSLDGRQKRRLLGELQRCLVDLLPEQHHAVIGGGIFSVVGAARQKMGDLL